MIRIIGKLFLFYLCAVSMYVHADVAMSLHTTDGKQLAYAIVGQPFVIEVEISDMPQGISDPQIFASSEIDLQRTGLYMSSINGHATKKYTYLARIDVPGTYTIGPATIEHGDYVYQSDEQVLDVLSEKIVTDEKTNKRSVKKKDDMFLRLSTDVQNAFVGQKVRCSVRFYTNNTSAKLQHLSPSVVNNAVLTNVRGPELATEKIDGQEYHYAEWSWDMYPETSGDLIIPAYSADYQADIKKDYVLRGFSSLLSSRRKTQRVYSNSVTIGVDELPLYEKQVSAVGDFDHFSASIAPGFAKEGEGVILSLELEGDGNWHQINILDLEGVPEALKYYDSNVTLDENNEHLHGKKRFDFIVQGITPGNWQIPSQSFTYFSTKTHSYKTLRTAPVDITITSNVQLRHQNVEKPKLPEMQNEQTESNLFSLSVEYPVSQESHTKKMSWLLFCLCALFPIAAYTGRIFYVRYFVSSALYKYMYKHIALYYALQKLRALEKEDRSDRVYYVFVNFLTNYYECSTVKFSGMLQGVNIILEGNYVNGKSWQEFFSILVSRAFGALKDNAIENEVYVQKELFEDARKWLSIIGTKI